MTESQVPSLYGGQAQKAGVRAFFHEFGDCVTVQINCIGCDKTDGSRVFSIIVQTPFEEQATYKVKTEWGVIKGLLDARLVQTLPYLLSADMINRINTSQEEIDATPRFIGEQQTTAATVAVKRGC